MLLEVFLKALTYVIPSVISPESLDFLPREVLIIRLELYESGYGLGLLFNRVHAYIAAVIINKCDDILYRAPV